MTIHHNINYLPQFKNAVITIGSFDGVHVGHQRILKQLNDLANKCNGESVVITFHPHPRSIIYPKSKDLRLLSSLNERIQLLEKCKIDHLVIVPFTIEFSQQTPQEYIESFLLKSFNPRYIVIGYDHKFGLNREGNFDYLKEYEEVDKMEVIEIPKFELDELAISSSKIRIAIADGDLLQANKYLGHSYSLSGNIVRGKQIGQTIEFPTANIKLDESKKLLPPDGVYAVKAIFKDIVFKGMMYIGNKNGSESPKQIEVNIFDFNGNIYDENIKVEIIDFIRENRNFDSLALLKEQLIKDKKRSRAILQETSTNSKNVLANIAILNYNGKGFLESHLPSVLKSCSSDFNITVIDNGSTDNSVQYLQDWHPEIRLIELENNLGFAEGYNEGIKQLKEKYTVLLNSDVEVEENWLDPILELMEKDPNIACCQPKIRSLENKEYFEYAGAAGGFIDHLGYPFCQGRIFDTLEKDEGQYDEVREIFWCTGAAMVIRTSLFKELQGFDGDYFAHQEEIDLCWRLKRAGYKCMVVPNSIVYHLGGGTLNYGNKRKVFLNFRNNLVTLLKNERKQKLLWLFPTRLILDGLAGLKFLVSGQLGSTTAIIKAHLAVYGQLFAVRQKRRNINSILREKQTISNEHTGQINKSIVWHYYLEAKKTFKSLILE